MESVVASTNTKPANSEAGEQVHYETNKPHMYPAVPTPGICVLKDVHLTGPSFGPDETTTTNVPIDTTHMDVAILPVANQGGGESTTATHGSTCQNPNLNILSCSSQALMGHSSGQQPSSWGMKIEETAIPSNVQQCAGSQAADMKGAVSNTPQSETGWQNLGVGLQPVVPFSANIRKKRASKKPKNHHSVRVKEKMKMEDALMLCTPQSTASGENPPSKGPENIIEEKPLVSKRRSIPKKRGGHWSPEIVQKMLETKRRNKAEKEKGIPIAWSAHSMSLRKSAGRKIVGGQEFPLESTTSLSLQETPSIEGTATQPHGSLAPASLGYLTLTNQPKHSEQLARKVHTSSKIPQRFKERSPFLKSNSVPLPVSNIPGNLDYFSGVEISALDVTHQSCSPRKRRACTIDAIPEPLLHRHTCSRNPTPTFNPKIEKSANAGKSRFTRRKLKLSSGRVNYQEPTASKRSKTECPGTAPRHSDLSGVDTSLSDALDISGDEGENGTPSTFREKLQRAGQRPRLPLYTPCVDSRQPANQIIHPCDHRYHPNSLSFKDSKWHVPYPCKRCNRLRIFCNRNMPCARCAKNGVKCERREGKHIASTGLKRRRQKKGTIYPLDPPIKAQKTSANEIENKTETEMGTETESNSEHPTPRPEVRSPKTKRESKSREPKKRTSNAVTYRGDPNCVWIERPHPQMGKPLCIGTPEVWCTNRQELCESLPYFRSYQSGTYHSGGVMRGYLADGCAGPRDFMNGRIVISHSGGKSATDEDGTRKLMSSQYETGVGVRDLINNLRGKWPMVIIMGDQCATSPSRIPYRYCVMDWFKVTAAWAEKDVHTNHVRWMFRFEKLDSTKLGWWASPTEKYDPSTSMEMLKACCTYCKEESVQVYEQGWMCLRPSCPKFWKLSDESPPDKLDYAQSFINCHTPWNSQLELPPSPARPPLAIERDNFYDGGDVARIYWKGMCCPQCGRLNCREYWAGWVCKNCNFKSSPPRTIFEADRLADPHRLVFTGPAIPSNIAHPGISWTRTVVDGMTCLIYDLKDCGKVTHILASEQQNKRPNSADWLFKEYQAAEMPFRRYPLKSHRVQGQLLTQQFSFNAGAPYKYIVAVDSTPFEDAPRAVTRSLELIQERVRLVHPGAEFNEVLSVGYFEGQKMDYHDDGEEELGETVASISLGSPAKMKFRIKSKYLSDYKLWNSTAVPKEPKAEPEVIRQTIAIQEELPENDDGDEETENGRVCPDDSIGKNESHKEPRVKLELRLNHGDVVVMKGREIQRIWEHAVHPIGLFRIAATARWINVPTPVVPGLATLSDVTVIDTGHHTLDSASVTYGPTSDVPEPEKITTLNLSGDRINIDPVESPAAQRTFSSHVTADNKGEKATQISEDMPMD